MVAPRPVVLDSSVALAASMAGGLRFPGRWRWLAPTLMTSEVSSALHEARWRGELTPAEAVEARRVFSNLPVDLHDSAGLVDGGWAVADELGRPTTYAAEFLALARREEALLVTADMRLRRGAARLGFVVDPVELTELAAS